jgi:hypothetical protein
MIDLNTFQLIKLAYKNISSIFIEDNLIIVKKIDYLKIIRMENNYEV